MTDAPHNGHDHSTDHDHGWRAALEEMRRDAAHFYTDHFDWRGHEPPADFAGPKYFPPTEDWQLEAWLDKDAPGTGDSVRLATSTGKLRDMTVAGQLVFEVDGREHRLLAYASKGQSEEGEEEEEGWLFVPFRDATSGSETYGAGRYVDVPPPDDADAALYDVDFNLAYNPSCAFSPAYDCPFPPPGNRLDIPVRAGEMVPFAQPH
jgi:uncharacterized protein (DUF1684 family)